MGRGCLLLAAQMKASALSRQHQHQRDAAEQAARDSQEMLRQYIANTPPDVLLAEIRSHPVYVLRACALGTGILTHVRRRRYQEQLARLSRQAQARRREQVGLRREDTRLDMLWRKHNEEVRLNALAAAECEENRRQRVLAQAAQEGSARVHMSVADEGLRDDDVARSTPVAVDSMASTASLRVETGTSRDHSGVPAAAAGDGGLGSMDEAGSTDTGSTNPGSRLSPTADTVVDSVGGDSRRTTSSVSAGIGHDHGNASVHLPSANAVLSTTADGDAAGHADNTGIVVHVDGGTFHPQGCGLGKVLAQATHAAHLLHLQLSIP